MEPRTISVDGKQIAIRPMGADYFMADTEPRGVTVDLTCRRHAKVWPSPVHVLYFKKLTAAYGATAILAWQDRIVVGFLPFEPEDIGMRALPGCVHYVVKEEGDENGPPAREIERGTPTPFDALARKVLHVGCVSVAPSLRRKGLGTAMTKYLVEWARTAGWERIQGSAFLRGNWAWLPNVEFWEKAGFTRGTEAESDLEFGPSVGFHIDLNG